MPAEPTSPSDDDDFKPMNRPLLPEELLAVSRLDERLWWSAVFVRWASYERNADRREALMVVADALAADRPFPVSRPESWAPPLVPRQTGALPPPGWTPAPPARERASVKSKRAARGKRARST